MASSQDAPVESKQEDEVFKRVPYEKLWKPLQPDGTQFGVKGIERAKTGGVKCVDKNLLAKQSGVLTSMIKQAGSNMMEGKSIINVSLPVTIFEPRSFLQRLSDVWCYAPLYLTRAALQKDPLERFKWVITFIIGGLHRGTRQLKPFNPILGETWEARFADGSKLYAEQISHHPPITMFEIIHVKKLWHFHGYQEYKANFRLNGLHCGQYGPAEIDFRDGTRISYEYPQVKISGLVWGDRLYNHTGTIVVEDKTHKLRAEIKMDPDAVKGVKKLVAYSSTPSDYFRGVIYRMLDEKKKEILCKVEGSWLDGLNIASKTLWNRKQYKPLHPQDMPLEHCLLSDSRHRPDLQALRAGDEKKAQHEKGVMENLQRADRKLRKLHAKEAEAARKAEQQQTNGAAGGGGLFGRVKGMIWGGKAEQ